MINKIRTSILSLFALSAVSTLSATDYWFKSGSFDYTSSWYTDNTYKTQVGTTPTNTETDDLFFYNTRVAGNDWNAAWLLGGTKKAHNATGIGNGRLAFGNEVLPLGAAGIDLGGVISNQIYSSAVTVYDMMLDTSFSTESTGSVDLVINAKGVEAGVQLYKGETFDTYQTNSVVKFAFSNNKVKSATVNIDGNVKIGGGLSGVDTISEVYFSANKVNISGTVSLAQNGAKWSILTLAGASNGGIMDISIGGLAATTGDVSIVNNSKNTTSNLIFKNAAGTESFYKGAISDWGLNWNSEAAGTGVMNLSMEGAGVQKIFVYRNGGMVSAFQNGKVSAKNGRFLYNNESIKAANRGGSLSLEGGLYGAFNVNSSTIGKSYFKTAVWKSGGFVYQNHELLSSLFADKTVITESFTKEGTGKISMDFSKIENGDKILFNPEEYGLTLYAYDTDVSQIEQWVELLVVYGERTGFKNLSNANEDFLGTGLNNANAVFKWVQLTDADSKTYYSLQGAFTQVPEPAAVAAIISVIGLGVVFLRKRKSCR